MCLHTVLKTKDWTTGLTVAWSMQAPSTFPAWFEKTKAEDQRAMCHLKLLHYFLGKTRNVGELDFLPSARCSMGLQLQADYIPLGGLPAADTPHWQKWRVPNSPFSSSSKHLLVKKWHINHHAPCPKQILVSLSSKALSHPHSLSSFPVIK